jgi:hypothetical protein
MAHTCHKAGAAANPLAAPPLRAHIRAMTASDRDDRPRRPLVEPEILPPDPRRETAGAWTTRTRIYAFRPGLLATTLAALALLAVAGTVILLLLGVFLLWLPIAVVVAAAVLLSRLLRPR